MDENITIAFWWTQKISHLKNCHKMFVLHFYSAADEWKLKEKQARRLVNSVWPIASVITAKV
jgi:hypothetical protein